MIDEIMAKLAVIPLLDACHVTRYICLDVEVCDYH